MKNLLFAASAIVIASPAWAEEVEDGNKTEIVVTATRSEQSKEQVPASIAVQDVEELRRNGFTFGTDEYRGVTGVFFRRGEGDGDEFPFLSFRGSTGTEGTLSLIDGVPLVGLYEETQLNEIPYDAIERIEIVKGPVSALYGRGALYGATNYITKSPRADTPGVALTGGSDGFWRGEATLSRKLGERGGILLSGSYEDYDGWRENGGRKIWNIFGKADFDLGDRTTLTAFANYNDRKSELPNGIPLDASGELLPFSGVRTGFIGFGRPLNDARNVMGGLKLEHRASDALTFTLSAQARHIKRDVFLNFSDPFGVDLSRGVVAYNGFRGATTQKVGFLEGTVNWQSGSHNIIAGINGERSKITEDTRWTGQNGFTPECGFTFFLIEVDVRTGAVLNRNNPCFVVDAPVALDRFTNDFWGAFIQDEISLSDRWVLTVGGRYDSFKRKATYFPIVGVTPGGVQTGKADAFSPKATLSYRPDWGQIYFAYGRGFNSNFGATFEWNPVQFARPETRPTTIDSYELGVKGRALDDALRFEAAVYYTRQKNRRQTIPNPAAETDFTAPFNLVTFGDLYDSKGAEVSLDIRPAAGTAFKINYSYIDPEWKDYVIQTFGGPVDLTGTTPVGVPKHIVYLQADQRITKWLSARAIFEFYDDYYYTQNNAFRDGGNELLTLGARIQPEAWRGVSLDLTLLNALNEKYYSYFGNLTAPNYAVPGPPRQFRATLKAAF
jgi:outer membrane receptor protein involved in Fe transport